MVFFNESGSRETAGRPAEQLETFLVRGEEQAQTVRFAHLMDPVFPFVPVRQWVLSLPFKLRYRLAYDSKLTADVVADSAISACWVVIFATGDTLDRPQSRTRIF